MKKIILFLTFIILIATLLTVPVAAAYSLSASDAVIDKAGLLTGAEKAEITEAIRDAESNCNAKIRVYVYSGYHYYDYNDYLSDVGYSIDDLVLLVIQHTGDEYYYYLDTYGSPHSSIKNKEVDRILDDPDVYGNIKSGELKSGIMAFVSLAAKAVSGDLRPPIGKVIVISLIIGALAALITSIIIVVKYKRKLHAPSYPLEHYARLNLTSSSDNYVTRTVTRTRINNSSGGGGRSGGGGGGGRRGGR